MIHLVRHGRTEFNAEGRYQGHCDSPLTEIGIAQAQSYGERLKGLIGDPAAWALVASPLGRAVQTAEIIAAVLGLPMDFPRDPAPGGDQHGRLGRSDRRGDRRGFPRRAAGRDTL